MAKKEIDEEAQAEAEQAESAAISDRDILQKARRLLKLLFSSGGVVVSVMGIFLSIGFYIFTSQAIDGLQTSITSQIDAVSTSLNDLDAALGTTQASFQSIQPATQNLTAALDDSADAAGELGTSLNTLATLVEVVPGGGSSGTDLRRAGVKFTNVSASLRGAATSIGPVSSQVGTLSGNVQSLRTDILRVRANLNTSKSRIDSSFNSLRLSAIIISLMFLFAFLALGSYSVAAFL